jgi:hypothetical protein
MATLPLNEDDRAIFLEQKELEFWALAKLYTALLNAWKIATLNRGNPVLMCRMS